MFSIFKINEHKWKWLREFEFEEFGIFGITVCVWQNSFFYLNKIALHTFLFIHFTATAIILRKILLGHFVIVNSINSISVFGLWIEIKKTKSKRLDIVYSLVIIILQNIYYYTVLYYYITVF